MCWYRFQMLLLGEAQWIVENLALRDEILSVRENAYSIRDSFANVEGTHWQTLQRYIDGTNSLAIGSVMLDMGEFAPAIESMTIATNLLQSAYLDERNFLAAEKLKSDPRTEEPLATRTKVIEKQKQASPADDLRIEDISITASHKQYDENKSRYSYDGKVKMLIGKFSLSADKVLIQIDKKEEENVLLIVALGNVLLKTEEIEAGASNYVGIDVKTGDLVLNGTAYIKLKTGQVQRGDRLELSHKFTKTGVVNENK